MKKLILFFSIFLNTTCVYSKDVFLEDMFNLKVKQYGANWCWAAVMESVYKHRNQSVTQLELIQGYTRRETKDILENKDSIFLGLPMSEFLRLYIKSYNEIKIKQVKQSLIKNQPVIYIADNHVMLIVGISKGFYLLMDPSQESIVLKKKEQLENAYVQENSKIKALFYEVI